MPFKYVDDGHRIGMIEDVMSHARQVFEQGLQLEAILLAHEYLEQKLNALHRKAYGPDTIHRRFKQLIDMFRSEGLLRAEDYAVLNEFNRLRNVNANQILDFSLTLRGAKKGDMIKAMDLAVESEQIISRLSQESGERPRKSRKKPRHG
ncbi:hypothetical protein [Nitrososphaera sp.]|uniref:hypothetical protein n=1 Tax=Nitrososphaera sp. TaxID=1971748 RepID=UPI0017DDE1FF|nr:hypothetical protein [Nitrososphaera sp.]NWG37806.1 hypothetical protein [Nitrososphaera sp.]